MKILSFANTDWYLYNYRMPIDKILRSKGYEVVMISPPGPYSQKILDAGFRWIPINMSRSGLNIIEEFSTIKQLIKIYKEEKPHIVHHCTMKCNLYGSLAASIAKVPMVVDSIAGLGYVFASDDFKAQLLRPFGYWGYRLSLANSKVIFQNQEDYKSFVDKEYVKKKDAFLIKSSGVDLDTFIPQPIIKGETTILLGSRMLWTKGIGEFVEAAKIVKRQFPNTNFHLAGGTDPGNPSSINKKQLEDWDKEGNVKWLGFQSDILSLINQSHIICFPSKHKEGTPKFLVEAAACGRPIITTQNRGCQEVVDDGVNGFLVPKGDSQALATAILKLLKDRELIEQMGKMSRIKAVKEFDLKRVAEDTHLVYQNAKNQAVLSEDFEVINTEIAH